MSGGEKAEESETENLTLEWDYLGRLPVATKLDDLLIQNGMIRGDQFLDQRLTAALKRLGEQSEIVSGRAKSIILSRVENESGELADIYVTKLDIEKDEGHVYLVPEDRLQTGKNLPKFKLEQVYNTLTENNGLFFILDLR